jgi:putative ABC transport system permease protein
MQFDVLCCIKGRPDYAEHIQEGLNSASVLTLIQLKQGTNVDAFRKKISGFGETYFKDEIESGKKYKPNLKDAKIGLSIRPFSESHYNASAPWFYFTDVKSLYQLVLLALIALGIACLNYVLLSLSRIANRSHEAGVRRTVGAGWKHMMSLFLSETWLLVLLAMICGFVLAVIALPYFNELTKVDIGVAEIVSPKFIGIAFVLVLLLTLVAGIYPAVKMAGIRPLNVLSKFGTYKLNPTLSKIFISLQYTACIVLIVFSIVIARQIRFINNKDLGFDKEQTILVRNPYGWGGGPQKTLSLREGLYRFASSQASIAGMTGATFRYGIGSESNGHTINGVKTMINSMYVDYDYFEYNRIPIIKGRSFSREFPADTSRLNIPKERLDSLNTQTRSNMVVNETLYSMLGQPPLNELNKPLGGYIVGVCKDYFFMGLDQKIAPAYHRCRPDRLGYFWFRIAKGQDIAANISKLKSEFNKETNGEDFSYYFMDEDVKNLYESHERWLKIISFASWMAIFIACLGLFGLSAVVAVNRTKEIGIRKVLGASVTQLFYALNKQSLMIVLVSILTAIPIANYVSNNWLENFAYRIQISWVFFALASFIGFACALISVSYHTLKVANGNPVESLRTE